MGTEKMGKRTIGDIDCPLCKQTLVRLDEDCNGKSRYWCDKCLIDIVIITDEYQYFRKDL